jgi:hypothetical protein
MGNKFGRILNVVGSAGFNSMWDLAAIGLGIGVMAIGTGVVVNGGEELAKDLSKAGHKIAGIIKEGTEKVTA